MELGGGGDHHHHQHESGAGVNPLAVTHLLQHTLRSLCIHENSQWVYAVFWRILPRNYPPPKWDLLQGGGGGAAAAGGARGNRRNWILVWEDGFCNFAADNHNHNSNINNIIGSDHHHHHHHQYPPPPPASSSSAAAASSSYQTGGLLLPEVFFKMSHEIYNYGEGLIGKVAADHSHKWIYKDPNDQEINFLSAWQNSADSQPRAWEAQFHSGIKTIALIAVREGVLQLGALHKVIEDLSYVVSLRKKFSYIGSIPGVLLPHPSSSLSSLSSSSSSSMSSSSSPSSSSSSFHPYRPDCAMSSSPLEAATWLHHLQANHLAADHQFFHFNHNYMNINNNNNNQAMAMMRITPSMSSLEALLSKLPSVVPPPPPHPVYCHDQAQPTVHSSPVVVVAKEEEKREREEDEEEEEDAQEEDDDHHHHHHHQYGHVREEDIMGVENNSSCLSSYDHLRHDDSFGYHFHHHQL